jgi:hypothetical protein
MKNKLLLAFFLIAATINAQTLPVWPDGTMPGSGASEPEKELPNRDGYHRVTNVSNPTLTLFCAPKRRDLRQP